MSGVSVVVPCRDGAALLAQTLRSVLNQTAPPLEVIVVDDGSRDDTRAVAEGFGPPVVVLSGPAEGAPAARNRGAAAARGARLMFLDADDLLTPPTLAALGAGLDATPERAALSICPFDRYEREGAAWLARPPTAAPRHPRADALGAWLAEAWSPPCCLLWTREGYALSGGWDAWARVDQDGILVRRALARGVVPRRTDDGLALYRRAPVPGASLSGRRHTPEGLASRLMGLRDTHDALLDAGRLEPYRDALAGALDDLSEAAMPAALDVAAEASRLARDLGGASWRRRLGRRLGAVETRLARRVASWSIRPASMAFPRPPTPRTPPASLGRGPLVSVIVPTFDRAALVTRAVRSVLDQDYEPLEVIVVDDGSTDDTQARLAAIEDDRLRVIVQPNGGVARARNRGIAEARGAYLAFLDSDDAWRGGTLSRLVATLEGEPSRVGLAYVGIERCPETGPTVPVPARAGGRVFEPALVENPVQATTSASLVRREAIEAIGGFDPTLPAMEDWDWLQRLARLYDILPVEGPLVLYDAREDPSAPRRSRRFRANMRAREMLWQRNAHALRRVGLAHVYLMESARRELREAEGDAWRGRALVLRALAERPQAIGTWVWLAYMLAPFGLRAWLRRLDAPRHARRMAAAEGGTP